MSEELRFDNRVVIVTGSSKGIGKELAAMFGARGAKVVVNARTRSQAEESAAEIVAKGGAAIVNVGDISKQAGANALIDQTLQTYGRIDALVNNAGVLDYKPIEETAETYDAIYDVNVRGTFNATRAAWPHMVKQRYGRILVFSSQSVYGLEHAANYCSSKAALIGLMRTLSLEGKKHGINVNMIMPLGFSTLISETTAGVETPAGEQGADLWAQAATLIPAHMVAPPVGWLCHDKCEVTGEMFNAGGGRVARVLLAETRGFHDPNLSLESVRNNWAAICNETDYFVPMDAMSHVRSFIERNVANMK